MSRRLHFDPVASTTLVQMGQDASDSRARASIVFDDDSGGCYFYKVEITTP